MLGKGIVPYEGMDMYIFRYRYMKDGSWELANSKPCRDCVKLIQTSKIKKVYYSVSGSKGQGIICIKASELVSDHVSHGRRHKLKK